MATCYRPEVPEIESWCGRGFLHPSIPAVAPTTFLYSGYTVSSPGLKRSERGIEHQPPSSAEVKERVEQYLYSPRGPT